MLPSSTQRILIPIHIETLAGTSFELLVSPNEQIQYIKYQIEKREGIPISHQHLIWKTTELDDQSCLNDYHINPNTTLKLVLSMRGGPINTKRIPIEDNLLRDMSEYIDNSQEDLSSNKNVTFLVLRDGDQFNFFQVIDRGDGTLSPLSGSISATSMYNTHETITVEQERESDEKRQDDDRKTKQKMDLIRSKLKNHTKKDILRSGSSASKPIQVIRSTNSNGHNSSLDQHHTLSYSYSSNLFNTYNFLSSSTTKNDLLLAEEDSEDDDDDDNDDDDDDDNSDSDNDDHIEQKSRFTSRSYSPSIFYQNNSTTSINNKPILTDYISHLSSIHDQLSTPKKLTDNNNNHHHHQNTPRSILPQIIQKPLSISKYRHISLKNSTTSLQTSNQFIHNENLMLNKPIDLLKTPGKSSSPTLNANIPSPPPPPPPPPSKRQDMKSVNPIDNTKVTIEKIGPKTVSALLRQSATIEPVDTSRGVGKHLVSLLTTASKEPTSIKTNYKQTNRDVVIEENYKFDSKLTNPWMNNNSSTKLPPVILNKKSTSKCFLCKKKTGLATTYQCRCGSTFCSEHRYPEAHACAFDYKAEGKRLIERNNPLITAPKLPKI